MTVFKLEEKGNGASRCRQSMRVFGYRGREKPAGLPVRADECPASQRAFGQLIHTLSVERQHINAEKV